VLVLVDFSESARDELDFYHEQLHIIVNEMLANSSLVVGKITDKTEAVFNPFIDCEFPSENFWTTNPEDVKDMRDSIQTKFRTICSEIFRNPILSRETDILSGLGLIQDIFPTEKRRILVLLSDMLQCSKEFDLEKAEITEAYIRFNLIPNLQGVELYVAGARAPTQERYRAVKQFWLRFFAETGGELKSYAHPLLHFKLKSKERIKAGMIK